MNELAGVMDGWKDECMCGWMYICVLDLGRGGVVQLTTAPPCSLFPYDTQSTYSTCMCCMNNRRSKCSFWMIFKFRFLPTGLTTHYFSSYNNWWQNENESQQRTYDKKKTLIKRIQIYFLNHDLICLKQQQDYENLWISELKLSVISVGLL